MTSANVYREPAGVWLRVSSNGQDEANQAPDCERYCADHGYEVARTYTVHAKSAYHGRHQSDLDRAVADMREGRIRVLVIWHSSRIERRPGKALLDTLAEFTAAGGRVESVQEPQLGALDFGGQVMTFLAGLLNNEKSRVIGEGVKLAHGRIRDAGQLIGRPPWGYTTEGVKYARRLVPTAEGRTYVPAIYARCIAGDSLAAIGAWLTSEGVSPYHGAASWSPKSVGQLVRNATYAGRRESAGVTVHKCPALVDSAMFARAGAALDSRHRKPTRTPKAGPPALLTSIIHCARCCGPMYRTRLPGRDPVYRCSADPRFGSDRRSECRNLVDLAAADAKARELVSRITDAVMVPEWVDGDSTASELSECEADLADAMARFKAGTLPLYEFTARVTALDTLRKELAGREPQPGHYRMVDSGRTYGELAAGMTAAEFRTLLAGNAWIYMDSARPGWAAFNAMVPGEDGTAWPAYQVPPAA